MHVSAVMCTRNDQDLIGQAVASVLANAYDDFDLTVVDQSDNDRTGAVVRALAATDPRLRYHHTTVTGLSRAYNLGMRLSDGELLAFTDDDCVAPPTWIQSIVAAFDADPTAELLYGQVLRPAALADAEGVLPTLPIERAERLSRKDGFRIYGMGANFAARRGLCYRIGGFDEVLGGGGPLRSSQDFDFQYRAYRAGAVTLLAPSVRVDHYGVRADAQWPATLRAYGFGDGGFYFKHARCGDLFATGLLLKQLARLTAREALSALGVRRRPSSATYLRACLEGIRASLYFKVDRSRRMYVQALRAA